MIAAILAAGASTRFGSCKLIEPINGQPMIQKVIENLPSSLLKVLVTGYFEKDIRQCTRNFNLKYLHNPNAKKGLGTSIKTVAHMALEMEESLLITLGDIPFVTTTEYNNLIKSMKNLPVFSGFQGVIGPPAVIPRHLVFRLLELRDNKGARSVFRDFESIAIPGAARDIDRPEDLLNPSNP